MILGKSWRGRALDRMLDDASRAALRPHAGKVVLLTAGPARFALRVGTDGGLEPASAALTPDASIAFAAGAAPQAAGDAELLRVLGEARAALMPAGRPADWCRDAGERLGANVGNWLTNEYPLLASQDELRDLGRAARALDRRLDALLARAGA